jgi:hypothetical protein
MTPPETTNADLFTIEQSHEKPRLTAPRLSNLGTVGTGGDRGRNHDDKGHFTTANTAARDRSAKRALTAPLRAARKRLEKASDLPASVADELLRDALAVYGSAKAELGSSSVFVLANVVAFATESVLAGYFAKQSAEMGFDTERGGELLELAHRCETQSQRAMTAALAAAKALGGRKPQARNAVDRIRDTTWEASK